MKLIRLAIMTDEFDRRPERTLFFRRFVESCIANPEFDVTLVHSQKMPDELLYGKAREVVMRKVRLPWASHFATFIRYCLSTNDKYDIVHYFKGRLYPLFWLFPAKRVVVMVHGGGDRLAPGFWTLPRFIFVWVLTLFNRYIDAMIAVSDYGNREIIYAYHVPPEKVRTIYPHIDEIYKELPNEKFVRGVLEKYALLPGTYILYMGRCREHKNVARMIEGYLKYREQNGERRELFVVAGDPLEEYEKAFGPLPQSPYKTDIRFLGYMPNNDMPSLYIGARALVFATLNEGFGVPIIESMRCGTPVITSTVTAMPEVAGGAAILVDPLKPQMIAEALELLAKDDALRMELIRRGRERSALFTWERVIEQTFALYDELLGRTKKSLINPLADIRS